MIILGNVVQNVKQSGTSDSQNYAIDFSSFLTSPTGATLTISGAPSIEAAGCTASYISNSSGRVLFSVSGGKKGGRGRVCVNITLSSGETIGRGIEVTFE